MGLLEDKRLPVGSRHEPVAVTWEINVRAIAARSSLAISLLDVCAYLHPTGIPQVLLQEYAQLSKQDIQTPVEAKFAVANALETLRDYSMVKMDIESEGISLHRLVQTLRRLKHSVEEQQQFLETGTAALDAFYRQGGDTMAEIQRRQGLLPHMQALLMHVDEQQEAEWQWLTVLSLLDLFEDIHSLAGQQTERLIYLTRALEIKACHFGAEHIEVAKTLVSLGNAYYELGQYDKQIELQERALAIEERHFGAEHVEVAITLHNLAGAYLQQNPSVEGLLKAFDCAQRAYRLFKKSWGENHPHIRKGKEGLEFLISRLNQLGLTSELTSSSSFSPPERRGQEIATCEEQLTKIPEDATLHERLAGLYYQQNQLTPMIQHYEAAIRLNPQSRYAHHNLACAYHISGNILQADSYFQQALKLEFTASTCAEYGWFLLRQGQIEDAIKHFKQAIERANDGTSLFYGWMDRVILDEYLRPEISPKRSLSISPLYLAYYGLLQSYLRKDAPTMLATCLSEFITHIKKDNSALGYRLLSYITTCLGDGEQAETYQAVAHSLDSTFTPYVPSDISSESTATSASSATMSTLSAPENPLVLETSSTKFETTLPPDVAEHLQAQGLFAARILPAEVTLLRNVHKDL